MKDPYKILGVRPDAGNDELKQAFRRLARECHPDSDPDNPWAEDEFKELSAAYDLLSDSDRRLKYDRGEISGDGTKRTRTANKPHPESKQRPPHSAGPKPSKTAGLNIKGADVEYTLKISFMEAAAGTVRHISMATGKRLKVNIPPGTGEGDVLRLNGQGMNGFGGGGNGNAYVEIFVEEDPVFRRQGNDIHTDVPVTLSEAVLGGKVEAPTIDGSVTVTVPKGSNTGTQLRLKGKGLKPGKKDGGAKGDQIVHLQVILPKKPDKDLLRFLKEWSPDHPYSVRPKSKSTSKK
ncbi:MAG: DnaJ domain-containing protein [Proteobacteria bacterium]|nr:DnaJ domain-containing protein [Pseudomonadota bacterium]